MIMKEADFKKHIASKQFSNLYLIDGNEKMLVSMYTDALVKKLMGDNPPDFNFHLLSNDSSIINISVAADVMPFMCDKNCVKITDFDIDDKDADDIKSLYKVLENLPDTTTLIFAMTTIEQEGKGSAKYKKLRDFVDKKGIVAELDKRSELALEKTVCKWAQECNSSISPLNAAKLINICNSSLNVIHSEIEKLSAFALEGEITEQMIDKMVAKNLQAKIYDLFDYVVAQNFDKAMGVLDVLFYQREEPIAIVSALSTAYVDMYRARIATENAVPMKVFADELLYKNRAWVLDKMAQKSRKISTVALRKSIDALLDVNEKLVSVTINQRVELEKLIARLILIARGDDDA